MTKTLQQAYEHVRKNLVEQKFPSMNGNKCLYRGPEGCKCAVGWLIDDEFYDPSFEDKDISSTIIQGAVSRSGWPTDYKDLSFYDAAQSWHDTHRPNKELTLDWLDDIARRRYNLNTALSSNGSGHNPPQD